MTVTSFSLIKKAGPIFGVRHLQVFFLFTCCVLAFQQKINVSVGIVAMTNANSTNPDFPEFDWNEREKSFILSAIFWGGLLTQLPGGFLSSRYGAKMLLLYSTLSTSLISIIIPFTLAIGGWQLFCVLRLLQGVCQGVMWPCFYSHLAKWCPVEERNRLGGITQTGMDVGTAIGFAASGLLAASVLGWPSMFYVPGMLGILWSILWLIYGANSPEESKIISMAELKMIQSSQEKKALESGNAAAINRPVPPVPWRSIITSVPYLVLALCKISQACSFHTLMQQIPTYIHGVFNYDIKMNALLSALPFCFMCLMSYVCLITADILTKSKVDLAVVRKSINSFASWVPAAALVALGYISVKNVTGSISCLVVAVAAISAQAIGSSLNHIDLAPNYAGLLYGLSDTLMSIVGVLSPIAVSLVVTNEADRTQWRTVYITIAAALFLGNLLYIIFGKMETQPWNDLTVETVMDEKPTVTVVPKMEQKTGKEHEVTQQAAETQSNENFRTLT